MRARKRPIPTAKLCLRLGEIDAASHGRIRSMVKAAKAAPLTKTAPSRCCQEMPRAERPKAMKAFSPM